MDLKDELQLHFLSRTEFEEISARSDPVDPEEFETFKTEIVTLKEDLKHGNIDPILAKIASFDEKMVSAQDGIEILTKTVQMLSDCEKIFEKNTSQKVEDLSGQITKLSEKLSENDDLGTV